MKYQLQIPPERKHALTEELIKTLEEKFAVKIDVQEDGVEIEGEGIDAFQAQNVLRAVALGFAPEDALLLLNEDHTMEVIEIPGDEKRRRQIKARLIGTRGIVRKNIERYTSCRISIFDKTVSIIGPVDKVPIAKNALEMIITGKEHATVYKYLESLRRRGVLE